MGGAFDVSSQENRPRDDGEKPCATMAQQHSADGASENIATPQKLLHLIGYRDANLKGSRLTPVSKKSENYEASRFIE
jgi:hypothetical protein